MEDTRNGEHSDLEDMLGSIAVGLDVAGETNATQSTCGERIISRCLPSLITEGNTEEVLKAFRSREQEGNKEVTKQYENIANEECINGVDTVPTTAALVSPVTYSLVRQRRSGPRHGKGGRRRGPTAGKRGTQVAPEICKVMARTTLDMCGGSTSELIIELKSSLLRKDPGHIWPSDGDNLLHSVISELVTGGSRGIYEVLPSPFYVVCTKVYYSQVGLHSLGTMDRYAVCTWLAASGRPMCSCVGSTRFRMDCELPSPQGERELNPLPISVPTCNHANGISEFIRAVSGCVLADICTAARAISDIYVRRFHIHLSRYIHTRPRVRLVHGESIAVISEVSPGTTDVIQFTPVRKMIRGSGVFVCAFCDTILAGRQGCHHTRVINTLKKDEEMEIEEEREGEGLNGTEDMVIETSYNVEDDVESDGYDEESLEDHKSRLPVSPVNCNRSLKVDQLIARCARKRQKYVLTAPCTCETCGAHRNPKSRGAWEGVIMCTLGPCGMEVETFRCAGCQRLMESEGMDHCVLIRKSTAASHALLRRELMGVALSNGTLNGRLSHFHSQVMSMQHAGIIAASPECRSVRTLHKLCHLMLKLMTLDPEKVLFTCDTCDTENGSNGLRRPALCVDGINQGYRKSTQVVSQNFVQSCKSFVSSSEASSHPRRYRPLTTLIRRNETVSIILQVVKGIELQVTKRNISDVAAAIRIVSQDALPPQFCCASICGRISSDYYEDIGENTVLQAVRKVTASLFHGNTLLLRLLKPTSIFISRCVNEGQGLYLKSLGAIGNESVEESLNASSGQRSLPHDLGNILHRLESDMFPSIILSGVCWLPQFRGNSSDGTEMESRKDALREVLDMYMMFLKGPVTQFVRRADIRSLRILGTACRGNQPSIVLKLMKDSSLMRSNMGSSATNLLKYCRLMQASLFSIVEVEKRINRALGQKARQAFGDLFLASAKTVQSFYYFYERIESTHSVALYASEWDKDDVKSLQDQMRSRFHRNDRHIRETPFQEGCRSGFYFPNHAQLRPLPFDSDNIRHDGNLVPCTKNYEQNQKSYTTGSVTVRCYCANSITYGYKVLYRDEGTKTILDTVISRFATMPWWLIYDFSCGLYQSAVHSLSWAIRGTRIVSDKFHAKNHTCSPGFFPTAYTELDHANTVAHEQRNRGIAALCKSLRNSSQEFYIGLLAYHTIIMNIRAKARKSTAYLHRDRLLCDYDVEWCYFHCLKLSCTCCLGI